MSNTTPSRSLTPFRARLRPAVEVEALPRKHRGGFRELGSLLLEDSQRVPTRSATASGFYTMLEGPRVARQRKRACGKKQSRRGRRRKRDFESSMAVPVIGQHIPYLSPAGRGRGKNRTSVWG
jgi:hypothetical protein